MSKHRFSSGTRFRWQGKTYEVGRTLSAETITILDIVTREEQNIEILALLNAYSHEKLYFLGRKQIQSKKQPTDSLKAQQSLGDYPEYPASIAKYRLEVIQPLLTLEPKERTVKAVDDRVAEVKEKLDPAFEGSYLGCVCRNSVYNWIQAYRDADEDIRALVPNTRRRGGKKKLRLDPDVDAAVTASIEKLYRVREQVTIKDVEDEVACEIEELNKANQEKHLEAPSRSTVVRRIQLLDVAEQFAIKHGRRAAKQQFTQYNRMEYPDMPGGRAEIDHTRADMVLIDDQDDLPIGRPTITLCLDMAARYPLGYYMGFEPPSYLAVMECLYHAILPKESTKEKYGTQHDWIAYGIPSTLVIDNGREFIGRDLSDACLSLGITLQHTPVRTPHLKPGIERFIGSLSTMFFHTMPGTTFSNPQQRGDYDSLGEACVYMSDIDEMFQTFIVDIYAESFHKGVNGIPARLWEDAVKNGFLPVLPDKLSDLQVLLGRVTQRSVRSYGVDFESIRYNCDELLEVRTKLNGKQTKIKYHPGDLSHIYVYNPFEESDEKYIKVPALDQEYTQNLSLWKHRIIRDLVLKEQDRVNPAALGRAKRKIREMVQAARGRKKASTRTRLTRWNTTGKPLAQLSGVDSTEEVTSLQPPDAELILPAMKPLAEENLLQPGSEEGWEITYTSPSEDNPGEEINDGR